ncbi:MAG TPA: ParM/StbA family protein [Bacillota bacterium]|nr:ParM/StbA family protein [Bacillota bacterium]
MIKNIGIDLGFGFVKVTDGEREYVIPSVVGIGQALTFQSELTIYMEPTDNLIATYEGKRYFVGELAVRQSGFPTRSLGDNHACEKSTKILLLTALSLFTSEDFGDFNIVTGLAPGFYSPFKDELCKMMVGRHQITVSSEGVDRAKTINIGKAEVVPQPMGTFFQRMFDTKGAPGELELAKAKVGIIDVGFRTTDFAIVNRLEYVEKYSCSTMTGISNAYGFVDEYLRNEFRTHKENFELDSIVQDAQIKIAGKIHSLDHVIKEAFDRVATKIIIEMNSLWDARDLDLILITGGGGKALAESLIEGLPTAVIMDDPQAANARGYQRLAQKRFGIVG